MVPSQRETDESIETGSEDTVALTTINIQIHAVVRSTIGPSSSPKK